MSRVSEGVPGEPGRLHAPVAGADRSVQGGEATAGPAAEGENLRKPETFSQRAGGAEEPGIRRRTAAEIGRSRSKFVFERVNSRMFHCSVQCFPTRPADKQE